MLISITLRTTVGPVQSSYEIIMFVANEPQQCWTNVVMLLSFTFHVQGIWC